MRKRVVGPLAVRLWAKVRKTEACWLWSGGVCAKEYGMINTGGERTGGRMRRTHRVAWEIVNGPIPKGMHVLHSCDVRNCVAPHHLFLGTNADNVRDRHEKGRSSGGSSRGVAHPMAKLSNQDVVEIRRMYAGGMKQRSIARLFGVSQGRISMIVALKNWAHVAVEAPSP